MYVSHYVLYAQLLYGVNINIKYTMRHSLNIKKIQNFYLYSLKSKVSFTFGIF